MQHQDYEMNNDNIANNDLAKSWVTSSRFIFYLKISCVLILFLGGCYNLYQHRYHGKPDVAVPENTLFTPKYK